MNNNITIFANNIRAFMPRFNRIFYSNVYFALLLFVAFTCWLFEMSLLGIYVLLAIAIIVLITNEDVSPVLPIMALMLMCISDTEFMNYKSNMDAVIITIVLLGLAFVFNFVFYRHKVKLGKVGVPFILVCLAIFMGGIGGDYIHLYAKNMMFMLSLGPLMFGAYIACVSCIRVPHEIDTKQHFAKIITLLATMAALEVLFIHLKIEKEHGLEFIEHFRNTLVVGWGNRASLVIVLMLGLSSAFYMADNAKRCNLILYNFAMFIYVALMFTCGRGGMIFGTIELFMIAVYLLFKSKHKNQFAITLLVWTIGVATFILLNKEAVLELLDKFEELGLKSSARVKIYEEGFRLFKANMLFGIGFGYTNPDLLYTVPNCIFFFHDTVLQILASMGIFGAICYATYYIARIRVLLASKDMFNIMAIFALLCFELQSLIDSGTFEPLPMLYIAVLINTFVEVANEEDHTRAVDELYDSIH